MTIFPEPRGGLDNQCQIGQDRLTRLFVDDRTCAWRSAVSSMSQTRECTLNCTQFDDHREARRAIGLTGHGSRTEKNGKQKKLNPISSNST